MEKPVSLTELCKYGITVDSVALKTFFLFSLEPFSFIFFGVQIVSIFLHYIPSLSVNPKSSAIYHIQISLVSLLCGPIVILHLITTCLFGFVCRFQSMSITILRSYSIKLLIRQNAINLALRNTIFLVRNTTPLLPIILLFQLIYGSYLMGPN